MLSLYLLIFSYLIGSFLNVVISRLPIMIKQQFRIASVHYFNDVEDKPSINLFSPASHCPTCKNFLTWKEMIPLFSFILQRGHCKHCSHPIAMRYFIVEIITLVLSMLLIQKNLPPALLIASLLFTWHLIVLAFIDLEHQLLPDSVILSLMGLGLLCNSQAMFITAPSAMLGGVLGFSSLHIVGLGYKICTGKLGLGGGDSKLFATIGMWLGWQALLPILLMASCSALATSAVIFLIHRRLPRMIPFGPYLAASSWFFSFLILL
jgi:leader peptidase (prepilin peptidase)/N-methyltransferase